MSEETSSIMSTQVSTGKIVQIIGAVIDVQFPREQIPNIYEALKLEDVELTLMNRDRKSVV